MPSLEFPRTDREAIRRTYIAFKLGAGLYDSEVDRLLRSIGVVLTRNQLHELGRNSDRSRSIDATTLWALITAWAQEQLQARGVPGTNENTPPRAGCCVVQGTIDDST